VKTTLDVKAQAAAEHAVAGHANAGLVVIQPSTGNILAVANNPPGGYDRALLAKLAPGSTMKVITSAALLARGTSPSEQVSCPDTLTVDGKTFHNSEGEVTGTMSLTSAFARSCNTAFLGLRGRLPDGALNQEATSAFGLTAWDIGLGETVAYGQVPTPDGPTTAAADLIGQGTVQMSPLAMASVAATVATGSFHQPVLVPNAPRVHAAGLPAGVAGNLRTMMRAVVTSGTARTSLAGLGDVAAKTGTAQVAGSADNAWLTAFRGDIAAGCLVEGGGYGASSCGPIVHQLLQTLA
jgi:cell division protein FtsI/penicillin-binding protein 2